MGVVWRHHAHGRTQQLLHELAVSTEVPIMATRTAPTGDQDCAVSDDGHSVVRASDQSNRSQQLHTAHKQLDHSPAPTESTIQQVAHTSETTGSNSDGERTRSPHAIIVNPVQVRRGKGCGLSVEYQLFTLCKVRRCNWDIINLHF